MVKAAFRSGFDDPEGSGTHSRTRSFRIMKIRRDYGSRPRRFPLPEMPVWRECASGPAWPSSAGAARRAAQANADPATARRSPAPFQLARALLLAELTVRVVGHVRIAGGVQGRDLGRAQLQLSRTQVGLELVQ